MTCLTCAAYNGHYEIIKLLIEKGANLEAMNKVREHHQIMITDPSVLNGPLFICPLPLYIRDLIFFILFRGSYVSFSSTSFRCRHPLSLSLSLSLS